MRIAKFWTMVVIAGFSGCVFETKEQVAGGAQDFPNTVALGKATASHISENGDWDQFSAIPTTLPDLQSADSIAVPAESLFAAPKVSAALLKQGAVSDSAFFDYSDTATLKVIRRIHNQETLIKIKADTVTFRYDGTITDSIKGNELVLESKGAEIWKLSQRLSAYRYENTDSIGGLDRATFLDRTPSYIPIGFRVKVLILTSGVDGDFLTKADNVPLTPSRVPEPRGRVAQIP